MSTTLEQFPDLEVTVIRRFPEEPVGDNSFERLKETLGRYGVIHIRHIATLGDFEAAMDDENSEPGKLLHAGQLLLVGNMYPNDTTGETGLPVMKSIYKTELARPVPYTRTVVKGRPKRLYAGCARYPSSRFLGEVNGLNISATTMDDNNQLVLRYAARAIAAQAQMQD